MTALADPARRTDPRSRTHADARSQAVGTAPDAQGDRLHGPTDCAPWPSPPCSYRHHTRSMQLVGTMRRL